MNQLGTDNIRLYGDTPLNNLSIHEPVANLTALGLVSTNLLRIGTVIVVEDVGTGHPGLYSWTGLTWVQEFSGDSPTPTEHPVTLASVNWTVTGVKYYFINNHIGYMKGNFVASGATTDTSIAMLPVASVVPSYNQTVYTSGVTGAFTTVVIQGGGSITVQPQTTFLLNDTISTGFLFAY